jgi:hypothetical protein
MTDQTDEQRASQQGSRCERHDPDDNWHEWSVGIGDGIEVNKPARTFVRYDGMCLIEITSANVTSWGPGARQLEGALSKTLHISTDEALFLLEVLPKALALAGVDIRAEQSAELERLLQVAVEAIRLVHGSQLGDHYSHEPCGECGLGGEGAIREALTKALGPGYTKLIWGNDMNADWERLRAASATGERR